MSERLSRMERYGQRRHPKDRHQRSGAARKHPEQHRSSESTSGVPGRKAASQGRLPKGAHDSLKRNRSISDGANTREMAKSGHSGEHYAINLLRPESEGEDQFELSAQELPSRREVYPSQRVKLTKYFVNTLLFIFVAVMVALFWWGISESPWGKSHGM
ncbi:hypothetical protein QNH46_14675 [Paenibacillus woosongensis]|uniref:Uncharacterized protein n=1 Tax=Paenibacillus woosongensis TaxID=307580 RepID=A0AA95I600_9BACL|nr:hypothetical protein [Paenibacillus woosongensis]WHX47402.1 hypothetical protein QNH46_14675 [Paenibacillus woosongensis]